ncbi:hypothetical protein [Jiangella alkaliphila]|uniref:hypothetical protein n=1 Tax=Jiangella alkaliphila TaxID=419479 RepID=UPI0006293AFF|nr:hypothetical protein [Jiangella alkaliphila]
MESFVPALVMALVVFVLSILVLRRVTTPASLVRLADRLPSRPRTAFSPDEVRRQATGVLNRLADELSRTNPAEVDRDLYERAGTGLDDLRVGAGRSHVRYRPCFFNPLHDQATGQADYVIGSGTVSVPVCRRCQSEIRRGGHDLDAVPSDTRPGEPYFLGDDEWAVTGYGALVEDLPAALFRYQRALREDAR